VGADWAPTCAACILLPVIEGSLRLIDFLPTLAWLCATAPPVRLGGVGRRDTERVRRAVDRASRHGLVGGRCLSQSLALWWLLRLCGIGSRLKLGVLPTARAFEAHAWLENESGVINDSADVQQRYPAAFAVLG